MKKFFLLLFVSLFIFSCSNSTIASSSPVAKVYYHYKTIEPYLCLTFDDGPDKVQTPKVLEILKKYKAKATFFVVGEEIEYQKNILKKVFNDGHDIGNHFYAHENINKLSESQIKESIKKTNDLIYEVTNKKPKYVRPPYGIVNDKLKKVCGELGMDIIIWTDDKDSLDWKKTVDSVIINNLTKKVSNGDIFLFHDGNKTFTNTLSAIDVIIPTLQKKGYKFVTVSTLLAP